jgi:hypothetical protein
MKLQAFLVVNAGLGLQLVEKVKGNTTSHPYAQFQFNASIGDESHLSSIQPLSES